jgi:NADH dehydrogenase
VRDAQLRSTVFAPSIVYAPGDPWLTLLERLSLLPLMPISGSGRALYQPIWAEDVADCVIAELRRSEPDRGDRRTRYELAGPETLTHSEIVRTVLRSLNRTRPLVHVPTPIVSRSLRLLEAVWGPRAFATWDEAELMEVPMIAPRGTADPEALGVSPQRIAAVLGRR